MGIISCNEENLNNAYGLVEKNKKKFAPSERDDALKRAQRIAKLQEAASVKYKDVIAAETANKASNRAFMDSVVNQRFGKINDLNPANRYRVEAFLANWIGVAYSKLNTGKLSNIGQVRDRLLELRRYGTNIIDLLVDYKRNEGIGALHTTFNNIAKKYGIQGSEANNLLLKAIEVGEIPQQKVARNIHAAGHAFLDARYNNFVQELAGKGFQSQEIEEILASAHRITAKFDSVRMLAQSMGLDVGYVDGIGYMPRMFTPAGSKHIKGFVKDEAATLYEEYIRNPNPLSLQYAFSKSRDTFHYIPEDEFLVSTLVGVKPEELRQMIVDNTFVKHLHENVSKPMLDNLVDTGLLSKVPMFSEEMVDYVKQQYGNLPFKQMEEILNTNPEQLYSQYKELLGKAAGESLMMKTLTEEGIAHGWSATPDMIAQNPKMYEQWSRLTPDEIRKYHSGYQGGDLLIQPEVWGTWSAIVDLTKSPEKMGTVANLFRNLGGLFVQSSLISTGYVLRNLWTNTVSLAASGGNLLRAWEGFSDVTKVMKHGTSILDDTKAVYKMGDRLVTKKRLFEEVFLHVGNNYVPQSSFLKAGDMKGFGNPVRGMKYLLNYSQVHGFIRPAKQTDNWLEGISYLLEQARSSQDVVFSRFAWLSQFNESAMKWATISSRADTSIGNRLGQFATATKGEALGDFADEMRHVDNYFYMWDDVGRVPAFAGRYVMPFASTMMKIPPSIVRHAWNNPTAFINYWRIRQFINSGAGDEKDELPEAGIAQWKQDASPLVLWKDPESKNYVAIMTNSFDPVSDTTSFFDKLSKRTLAATGIYTGSTEEQTRFIQDRYDFKDWSAEFFKNAPPLTRWAVEWWTGIDVRTGAKLEPKFIQGNPTFFGVRLNPVAKALLGAYPPLDLINRTNPFDMFGTPEVTDPRNPFKPLVAPKNSVFGKQRIEPSMEKYLPEAQTAAALAIRTLGIPLTVIETARQTQTSYAQMEGTANELKKEIRRVSNQLYNGKVTDRDELDNLYKQVKETREIEFKLRIATLRLELWMKQHNVPKKDVWNKLESLGANSLPPLAQGDADKMALDYVSELAKDDKRYNELRVKFGVQSNE